MLGILLTTLIFIGVLIGFSFMVNLQDIKKNWAKYRCRPDVMIMAPLYGQNAQDNLEFCLKQGFDSRAEGAIAPFYKIMAMFIGTLTTLLGSINNVKMIFGTILGGTSMIFSEFSQRFQALMYRIQMSVIRIKFLFSRVFAVIYSILFMGMGGMRAGLNFSNTFLFRFLDTFCFDPDTPIAVLKGKVVVTVPIKDVQVGDRLASGGRVTATFAFWADGQPMVELPGSILVSTNHYVQYKGRWIQARAHPDVQTTFFWDGGVARPLICLNTESHTFTIGRYLFRDYDETSEGDKNAMDQALKQLNGRVSESNLDDSTMACDPQTPIVLHTGEKVPAEDIQLGDHLSTGVVHGIINKETTSYCDYGGVCLAPGTAVWDEETSSYRRVGDFLPVHELPKPMEYCSFIITPSATIQADGGIFFRDYMEVHDPDLEASYAQALQAES